MRRRDYYWSLYHEAELNQLDSLRTDQVEAIYQALPQSMRPEWLIWRDGMQEWVSFEEFPRLLVALRSSDQLPFSPPPPVRGRTAIYDPAKTIALEDPNKTVVAVKKPAADPNKTKIISRQKSRHDDEETEGNLQTQKIKSKTQKTSEPRRRRTSDDELTKSAVNVRRRGPEEAVDLRSPDEDDQFSIDEGGSGEGRNTARVAKKFQVRIVSGDKTWENTTRNISMRGMELFDPLPVGLPRYFNVQVYRGKTVIPLVCSEVKSKDGSPSNRLKIEMNDYENALLTLLLAS